MVSTITLSQFVVHVYTAQQENNLIIIVTLKENFIIELFSVSMDLQNACH